MQTLTITGSIQERIGEEEDICSQQPASRQNQDKQSQASEKNNPNNDKYTLVNFKSKILDDSICKLLGKQNNNDYNNNNENQSPDISMSVDSAGYRDHDIPIVSNQQSSNITPRGLHLQQQEQEQYYQNLILKYQNLEPVNELKDSMLICKDIIGEIIEKGEQILADKKYEKMIPNHIVLRTFYLQEMPLHQEHIEHDIPKEIYPEDEEPLPPQKDFWRRMNPIIHKNRTQQELILSNNSSYMIREELRHSQKNISYMQKSFKSVTIISEENNNSNSNSNSGRQQKIQRNLSYQNIDSPLTVKSQKSTIFKEMHNNNQQKKAMTQINPKTLKRGQTNNSNNDNIFKLQKQPSINTSCTGSVYQYNNTQISEPYNYEIVDLSTPEQTDIQVERLRANKERFNDQQALLASNQEKEREKIKQMAMMRDIRMNQKYTYDYNGQIIMQNEYKGNYKLTQQIPNEVQQHQESQSDKAISSRYSSFSMDQNNLANIKHEHSHRKSSIVNTNIFTQQPRLQQIGKKIFATGPPPIKIRKNNQQVSRTDDIGYRPMSLYEGLVLGKGVTISQSEHDKKQGPKFEESKDNINDETLSCINPKSKIQMTREQYKIWKMGVEEKALTEQLSNNDYSSSQYDPFQRINWSERISRKKFDYEKSYLDGGNISVHNEQQFVQQFPRPILDDISSSNRGDFLRKDFDDLSVQSIKTIQTDKKPIKRIKYQRNIIDDFNVQFTRSQRGSQRGSQLIQKYDDMMKSSNVNQSKKDEIERQIKKQMEKEKKKTKQENLPKIYSPKPQPFQKSQSLGGIQKLPRNRVTNLAFSNYSFNKLPPPKIGDTIGHSINLGLNPESLQSMENILDKINLSQDIRPFSQKSSLLKS